MRIFIFLCVVASICVCGCDSGGDFKANTAQDKKDFAGGPMPADARAKFEAAMKQNDANRTNMIDKSKAAAGSSAGAPAPTRVGQGGTQGGD